MTIRRFNRQLVGVEPSDSTGFAHPIVDIPTKTSVCVGIASPRLGAVRAAADVALVSLRDATPFGISEGRSGRGTKRPAPAAVTSSVNRARAKGSVSTQTGNSTSPQKSVNSQEKRSGSSERRFHADRGDANRQIPSNPPDGIRRSRRQKLANQIAL
jgi:hypothetical protein